MAGMHGGGANHQGVHARGGHRWAQVGRAQPSAAGRASAHSTRRLRASCAAVRVKVVAQAWGSAMRALACAPARGAPQAGECRRVACRCAASLNRRVQRCARLVRCWQAPSCLAGRRALVHPPPPSRLLSPRPPGPTRCVSLAKAEELKAQAGEVMGTNSLLGFTRTITVYPGSA